jgi:hypothetical protein
MIENISSAEADALLVSEHYLGANGYPQMFRLSTPGRDALATYAPPIAQHFKVKISCCLELFRLWQSEDRRATGAPLSEFVLETIAWLSVHTKTPVVFSYADPGHIHGGRPNDGKVYQWAKFHKLGMSRTTDYWRASDGVVFHPAKMWRMHETKSRTKLQALGYELLARPPKVLYCKGLTMDVAEVQYLLGGRYK